MDKLLKEFEEKYVTPLKGLRRVPSIYETEVQENGLTWKVNTGFKKLILLLVPFLNERAKEAVMCEVKWTEKELCNKMKETERGTGSPFWEILITRISESAAGQFIEEFNGGVTFPANEKELMLGIVEMCKKKTETYPSFETENNIVDDMTQFLKNIIRKEGDGKITLRKFLRHLNHLRLCDSKVGSLDLKLRRLNTLQVLILSGNVIEELPFHFLPSSLRVLELHNNIISNVYLTDKTPPPLVFLGLSSNYFSDGSVMEGIISMQTLFVLDLSDNNIFNITALAKKLRKMPNLCSLCLKGNPCSTIVNYKNIMKTVLPKLQQLDGKTVRDSEKSTDASLEKNVRTAALQEQELKMSHYRAELKIIVFRIMGIPKPTLQNKKYRGFFQFEVELPLLDHSLEVWKKCHFIYNLLKKCDIIPNIDSIAQDQKSTEPEKQENTKKEHNVHGTKPAAVKEKSVEKTEPWKIRFDKFLSEDKEIKGAKKFVSQKMHWSTIMKPKDPIVVLPLESNQINTLRDTLRSIITIRLFYKQEGSSKDAKRGIVNLPAKKLVAKISVPAEMPRWNEQYCGYEWNAKKPCMASYHPNIANMKFPQGNKDIQHVSGANNIVVDTLLWKEEISIPDDIVKLSEEQEINYSTKETSAQY